MQKPYVNCVMMISIDGKIDGNFFDDERAALLGDLYEEIKLERSDAWGNGSTTHKMYFGDNDVNFSKYQNYKNIAYEDKIILDDCPYVVCFDSKGKVNWNTKYLEYPEGVKNRVVEVLTKKVQPEFLAYLDEYEIPYIFAGEDSIDLKIALDKLSSLFNIKRFAICGGGKINGAFFQQNLVDEITLVVAPFIEGTTKGKSIADADISLSSHFYLKEMKTLPDNGILLTYVKKATDVEN